jgi:hypothetical protein
MTDLHRVKGFSFSLSCSAILERRFFSFTHRSFSSFQTHGPDGHIVCINEAHLHSRIHKIALLGLQRPRVGRERRDADLRIQSHVARSLMNSAICASLCTGFKTFVAAPEARIAVITITEGIIADGAMAIRSSVRSLHKNFRNNRNFSRCVMVFLATA